MFVDMLFAVIWYGGPALMIGGREPTDCPLSRERLRLDGIEERDGCARGGRRVALLQPVGYASPGAVGKLMGRQPFECSHLDFFGVAAGEHRDDLTGGPWIEDGCRLRSP